MTREVHRIDILGFLLKFDPMTEKNLLLIVGAGGHAKAVSDTARSIGIWEIACFLDDIATQTTFLGKPLYNSLAEVRQKHSQIHHAFVAIGNNRARKDWMIRLSEANFKLPTLIHPSALITPESIIQEGTFIGPRVVLGYDTEVGSGVILNTGTIVEHDARVGSWSHISPGSIVCGAANVGDDCLLGPGCIIDKTTTVPSHSILSPNSIVAVQ